MIRRDKSRVGGFESPPPLEEEESNALPVHETSGLLSEMFDFPSGMAATASTKLLDQDLALPPNNQAHRPAGESKSDFSHQRLPSINADSAAAMHLFLMNRQPISPSSSTSLQAQCPGPGGSFGMNTVVLSPPQIAWVPDTVSQLNNPSEIGGVVESQGLSLSLSSPFPHLEVKDGGLPYYTQAHVGLGSSLGMVNVLRNSKYLKVAQQLLEEFCSVGGGQLKKNKFGRNKTKSSANPGGTAASSSLTKDLRPSSPADRIEHQSRKVKLLAMLDEVERRYKLYCEQMKMVVDSLDQVMGNGAAVPYTALAQKAMSRHFRSLKDSISAQWKRSYEILGDKDGAAGISGITKGETPRPRMLEQTLRQQRGLYQMGGRIMEHEPWRQQRGLPERSVNILRAWLFQHFLHPYPSDSDKHLLARQTGLSRNQVSNWFINARVRLWKPMVEEMYQQEKEEGDNTDNKERERNPNNSINNEQQTSSPLSTAAATVAASTTTTTTPAGKTRELSSMENGPDISSQSSRKQCTFLMTTASEVVVPPNSQPFTTTNAGDVSLTLGLRHTGDTDMPDQISSFSSLLDFGGC